MVEEKHAETIKEDPYPQRKVVAGAIAGFAVTIIVFFVNTYVITDKDKKVTPELSASATTLLTLIVSYFIPHGTDERIILYDKDDKPVKDGKDAKYAKSGKSTKPPTI